MVSWNPARRPGEPQVSESWLSSGTSESEGVLQLRRTAIEARVEMVVVECSDPTAVENQKEVVARSQNPSESALQTCDAGFVVVLDETGPRDLGGEIVIGPGGQYRRLQPYPEQA